MCVAEKYVELLRLRLPCMSAPCSCSLHACCDVVPGPTQEQFSFFPAVCGHGGEGLLFFTFISLYLFASCSILDGLPFL
ncbi:hypothetical protein DUNSADRAFT_8331 [Dunaliella salina]|uniref:Uncharacterized protein n=1 Tax=Dunaliella salina TaxID=3046 RepID=A0ABQ7H5X4_DUNSA|nr:hypothetical protein DUNSADRAFT_8331 [Dunaliella salina]|eukprot:KAF5842268.1 hypothetical protein DUNSADRAFT_8331 [Dunaliella salina]